MNTIAQPLHGELFMPLVGPIGHGFRGGLGAVVPTLAFIGSTATQAGPNFTAVPIGAPTAERHVIVCLMTVSSPITGTPAVTVAGNSANLVAALQWQNMTTAMYIAKIPSGVTADITAEFTTLGQFLAIYTIQSSKTAAEMVTDAVINTGAPPITADAVSIPHAAGDLLTFGVNQNGTQMSLSGVTNDFDRDFNSNEWAIGGHDTGAAAGTVTYSNIGSSTFAGVAAAFIP